MGSRLAIPIASERVQRTCALSDSVSRLRYVSDARAEALEHLGISTVRDLLLHVPRRYLDFTDVTQIAYADVGTQATIVGTVDKVSVPRTRSRVNIVELTVIDDTGVLVATFFRQPWLAQQIKVGDSVALSGTVTFDYGFKRMKAPFMELLDSPQDVSGYARVLPVHAVGEGITASWMRRIVSAALADVGDVCDWLPSSLVCKHKLMTLSRALREVHFPTSLASAEAARRRLAYDELLCLQLALRTRQQLSCSGITPYRHVISGPHMKALLAALPFTLTDEQRQAADEILADMAAPRVMNRLLLGDVGTGKTAVAAVALAAVADTGTQAAVMAPTSVLAAQHAEKLGPVLDKAHISWALLTGSTPADERAQIEGCVAVGTLTVVIGTTALLSESLEFQALSLVVIDEQHRFGVRQRSGLRGKGSGADLLAMTATPIPRTLALSTYGDLDISYIRHRPHPGAGVTTKLVSPKNLDQAWEAVRAACKKGRQAYVVCPLVDDADKGDELDDVPEPMRAQSDRVASVASTARLLAENTLPGISVATLTGRMSAVEKDCAMEHFRSGKTQVLVSTTVIEVGVDVPNATVMVVLDADRFGLATLHQLRGRVGRGSEAGTVYLCSAAKSGSTARQRLEALEKTSDGFELAELDLRLRHEGDVLGYRQSGGVTLRICDLDADADLVEEAHADAIEIVNGDPRLSAPNHRAMAFEVRDRFGAYFEELERA